MIFYILSFISIYHDKAAQTIHIFVTWQRGVTMDNQEFVSLNNSLFQNPGFSAESEYRFSKLQVPFDMAEKSIYKGQIIYKEIDPNKPYRGPVDSKLVDFGAHQHDFFELLYVLDGELTQHIENKFYRYKKGDACFLNRNIRHSEEMSDGGTVIYLKFSCGYIREILDLSKDAGDTGESSCSSEITRFVISNLDEGARYERDFLDFSATLRSTNPREHSTNAAKLLDTIAYELLNQQPGYLLMLKVLLLRLFRCLEDTTQFRVTHIHLDSSSEDFIFARVKNLLEEKHGRISRNEISKSLNYNGNYLNQIVKKRTGKSIHRLGQDYSLEEAKRQLRETDLSVNDILQGIGFANRTFFYKLFKEQNGVSPKEYRKQARANGS
jgi:AraC-like DNA-binding protein/mannose-6-phosphate isomerase-like protein (cupin superfamily)